MSEWLYYTIVGDFAKIAHLLRTVKNDQRSVVLTCALRGQYDIFVQARHRGSVKIEATAFHPQANWPLLNRTHRISIRSQNRVRKRQMIVKWDKRWVNFITKCIFFIYKIALSTGNMKMFCKLCIILFKSHITHSANHLILTILPKNPF